MADTHSFQSITSGLMQTVHVLLLTCLPLARAQEFLSSWQLAFNDDPRTGFVAESYGSLQAPCEAAGITSVRRSCTAGSEFKRLRTA